MVNYSDTYLAKASSIEAAIKAGIGKSHRSCSDELLSRIREGLASSPFTAKKFKDICGREFSEDEEAWVEMGQTMALGWVLLRRSV